MLCQLSILFDCNLHLFIIFGVLLIKGLLKHETFFINRPWPSLKYQYQKFIWALFTPPKQVTTQNKFFKGILKGLNSVFILLDQVPHQFKEPSLCFYLSKAGGRTIELIPFPRVLAQWEMQTALSRIWTWVAVFISYDGNYNTMNVYNCHMMLWKIYIWMNYYTYYDIIT